MKTGGVGEVLKEEDLGLWIFAFCERDRRWCGKQGWCVEAQGGDVVMIMVVVVVVVVVLLMLLVVLAWCYDGDSGGVFVSNVLLVVMLIIIIVIIIVQNAVKPAEYSMAGRAHSTIKVDGAKLCETVHHHHHHHRHPTQHPPNTCILVLFNEVMSINGLSVCV